MNGHFEYVNGFPVWVDEDMNLKTSFTYITTKISEDLPYFPSTTTKITKYENYKIIK
jgi:hypothetical protein